VPSVNAYLASQGAAAVVAGYLDPAQLAAVAAPTAAECAKMAGLPFAQVGTTRDTVTASLPLCYCYSLRCTYNTQ
jgi:hypothetical protein